MQELYNTRSDSLQHYICVPAKQSRGDKHARHAMKAAHPSQKSNFEQGVLSLQIDAAVRFLLPGELFNHAVSEGRKAVARALSTSE